VQVESRLFRRWFSEEAPRRRGWDNFYPKGKAPRPTAKPAGGSPPPGGRKPGNWDESSVAEFLRQNAAALVVLAVVATLLTPSVGGGGGQEISFQWFQAHLLAQDLVERVEVCNKQRVKVFVRGAGGPGGSTAAPTVDGVVIGSPGGALDPDALHHQHAHGGGGRDYMHGVAVDDAAGLGSGVGAAPASSPVLPGQPRRAAFFFNIGSVDAFERAMSEAQDALGCPPQARVPITYVDEVSWGTELMRLLPTLLLVGGYVWLARRQFGGMMGGGGGGPGGG
ncbi:hypothetical protein H632_c4427p0, partial [Helicosporidium sp. ATCC 50920]